MATKEARKLDLRKLKLDSGSHSPDGQFCVMEAVAYVAGEPWTDRPKCVSPAIGAFLRSWNDTLDEKDRQRLKPYIRKVIGTNTMRYVYVAGMRRDRVMHIEWTTPTGEGSFRSLCGRGMPFNRSINAPFALGLHVCKLCRKKTA